MRPVMGHVLKFTALVDDQHALIRNPPALWSQSVSVPMASGPRPSTSQDCHGDFPGQPRLERSRLLQWQSARLNFQRRRIIPRQANACIGLSSWCHHSLV